MKNLSPINENKDVVTKEYVDPIKSQAAINRTTLGTQCKNLLKHSATTKTINGITFTVNADGTITASGTATANAVFKFATLTLKSGTYKYSGISITPSTSTANMSVFRTSDWVGLCALAEKDTFTITADTKIECRAVIYNGYTANNVVFYPMLRYADITDSTYEPYQPSLLDRCLLKDTSGVWLGVAQSSSITIDNLSSYSVLWINVSGGVSGINFMTNLVVPVAYLAKSSSNRVPLAGGIPSSAYITSDGVLAAKDMNGTITAKVSGNTLDLTIGKGTIGSVEVISLM